MGLSVCTKTMLSVFQIIIDRRSSRLMVVPLAEKEMKASGAEWTGGICEKTGKQQEVVSPEVICPRTCWTAIPVAWAPMKRHSLTSTNFIIFLGSFLTTFVYKKSLLVHYCDTLLCFLLPLTSLISFPACSSPVLSALIFLSLFTFLFHGDIN